MVAAASGGPAVRRFGARRVTAMGSVLLAAALVLAGAAPAVWVFVLAMFVAGLLDAIVDAAQNVQGVVVEEWIGRSIINSLHALWSLGAALGGLIGAFGAARDIPLATQMLVNGALWAALALLASRWAATPHDGAAAPADDAPADSAGLRPWRLLIPLVVLAICGTLVEDIANNWTVLFLGREAGAPAGIAGLGFTVVIAAQFIGRLLGDPMTDRWGRERVAAVGGMLVALGFALVVAAPVYAASFAGFALAGFGCATLVPAAFAAAGRLPGFAHGTGIALLGWLMRLGFLLTSPVIGVLSDAATSLRAAMLVPLAAGLVAAVIAHGIREAAARESARQASTR